MALITLYFILLSLCRRTQSQVPRRIVGGDEVKPHSLPWQAYIRYQRWIDSAENSCGAVIICPKYTMTAAHCTQGKELNKTKIVAGAHDGSPNFSRI